MQFVKRAKKHSSKSQEISNVQTITFAQRNVLTITEEAKNLSPAPIVKKLLKFSQGNIKDLKIISAHDLAPFLLITQIKHMEIEDQNSKFILKNKSNYTIGI